jgi:hypothetical protein
LNPGPVVFFCRSRSRSPSENKARLPDELKKHLEFDLIDTDGMSEALLRVIPYKVVETNAKAMRLKMSPNSKQTQHSPRRTKRYGYMLLLYTENIY